MNRQFLLIAAVMLALICFTQGQSVQSYATYRGTTCSSSQNVANIYSLAIGICATTGCLGASNGVEGYSVKTECINSIPTSPSNGYYMITTYSDISCKQATTASSFALNTCIPVNNQTYGSVKYIGCSQMVEYSDKNCATVQESKPTQTASCLFGISIQCNGAANLSISALTVLIGLILAAFF